MVQGIYVKGRNKINIAEVDTYKDWHIEKPISGYEKYYVNVPSIEAYDIFVEFLKGKNGKI